MAKRGREECSRRKVSKSRDIKGSSIDRISILPDDLLVLILSSLPLKEAVATSILSSRWRYLWTFITKLDFDGTSSMVNMDFVDRTSTGLVEFFVGYEARFDKARSNYVEWVNHVIALHKSPDIEEFRVFFDLTQSYNNSIDEWLRFALTKKVQRLELNLTADASRRGLYYECYTLDPCNLLKGSFSDSIDHVKYLKKIFLNDVNVDGEALAFFLCNCPLLEHLSVSKSQGLMTLKIIGPFPSFKHLEINSCCSLRSVEIRDVNLVYLKYVGSRVHFVVDNLPLLVEMYIGGRSGREVGKVLSLFSSYIPQLEILTLDIFARSTCYRTIQKVCSAVKMRNLKQLTVKATIDYDHSLMIPITKLLHALQCLQLKRFVLEATHPLSIHENKTVIIEGRTRKNVSSYPQLKEIEFVGYQGDVCELELLTHFLDNAVALENILVDTHKPIKSCEYLERIYFATHKNKVNEVEVSAKRRAREELPVIMPPKVNLKIL